MLPLLALVVAVGGLSAIPAVSTARTATYRQAAGDPSSDPTDTSADDTSSADDPTDSTDGTDPGTADSCTGDVTVDDGLGSDPGTDPSTDGTGDDGSGDFRAADGTGDTSTDTPDDSTDPTDTSGDTPDDSSTVDDCSGAGGTSGDGVDAGALKKLLKTGGLSEDVDVPGPGVVDGTLESPTAGAASVRAAKSHAKVLGRGHQRVSKAGRISLRIRLTGYGKRTLRKATKALRVTLHTRIRLKSGKTIDRSRTVTIQPVNSGAKPKHKPKKP